MAEKKSRRRIVRAWRNWPSQICTVNLSVVDFTKGLFRVRKNNCLGVMAAVILILIAGLFHEGRANVTCNYTGNTFNVAACLATCLPKDNCYCLEGNITASVTLADIPGGYNGDGNVLSLTANAPGFTLSCSGAECDTGYLNPAVYIYFIRGKITNWYFDFLTDSWPDPDYEIYSSGPVSVPPPYGSDYAQKTEYGEFLGDIYTYPGGNNNSPGTWTCAGIPLAPPTALINTSPPIPSPHEQITFDASSSSDPDGTIVQYHWDFGDGSTGDGVIVNHAYTQSGLHTVTLTVTDNDSLTDSYESTILVISADAPNASFIFSPSSASPDEEIAFNAHGSIDLNGIIVGYHWDFGDGSTGDGVTTTHAYTESGQYTVTLTVTDNDGLTGSTSRIIDISYAPIASFIFYPPNPCPNQQITFDASSSSDPDGTIVQYHWDFGDGSTGDGVTTTHAYTESGAYTVTLTVTDNKSRTGSASKIANILSTCGTVITTYDIAGTWYFQVFGDSPSTNAPYWGRGTMTIDATGIVTGGTKVNDSGIVKTITGGSFMIDTGGQVVGTIELSDGTIETLSYGTLDKDRNILTMVGSDPAHRHLFMAEKNGGTFVQADLAGTWHFQVLDDSPSANAPYWASGTIIVNAYGGVTGGSAVNDSGVVNAFTGGSLTINSAGLVNGTLTVTGGFTGTLPSGKLAAGKNVLTMLDSSFGYRGMFVMVRGGGTFTQRDLAGTWHYKVFSDNPTTNGPQWDYGTMTVNANGAVTGGTSTDSWGQTSTLVGGSLTIDSAGLVSGTMLHASGMVQSLPHGKLDEGGSFLTMVSSSTSGLRGLFVANKSTAYSSPFYATYTGSGLYKYDGTAWARIDTVLPVNMVASSSSLYATYTGSGLYKYDGTAWARIDTIVPANMVASSSALYATYTGSGLYKYNGTSWTRIDSIEPAHMAASDTTLYATFIGYGLYKYDGAAWNRIDTIVPDTMAASGSTLYATYSGYGLYKYDGTTWNKLDTIVPSHMVASGSTLYATFTGYGLYKHNGTSWARIDTAEPSNMVASGTTLYAIYTGSGLYKYDGTTWTCIDTVEPASMAAGQ